MVEKIMAGTIVTESLKTDSVDEIKKMQQSEHPKLNETAEIEIDTKYKVAKIKNTALSAVYNFPKLPDYLLDKLAGIGLFYNPETTHSLREKISRVVDQEITLGKLPIIIDSFEQIMFHQDKENLRELFENLLVSTIDTSKQNNVHPQYVSILKNMLPDEARLLKDFAPTTCHLLKEFQIPENQKNRERLAELNNSLKEPNINKTIMLLQRLNLVDKEPLTEGQWLSQVLKPKIQEFGENFLIVTGILSNEE